MQLAVLGSSHSLVGLLTAMFGAAGTLYNVSARAQNLGKTPRYKVDNWDEMMMKRDETPNPRAVIHILEQNKSMF